MPEAVASPHKPSGRSDAGRLYGEPVLAAGESVGSVGCRITGLVLDGSMRRRWWIALAGALGLLCAAAAISVVAAELGSRDAGPRLVPVLCRAGYGWWLGLASGCLLVSAVLLLSGVEWRCAVSRIAETSALLCTIAAAPLALARSWSPTSGPAAMPPWDPIGFSCMLAVCASLWSVGLLPDVAALRDGTEGVRRPGDRLARIYRLLALGWCGSALQWRHWVEACRSIALLGAVLAVAVQADAATRLAGRAAPGLPDGPSPDSLLPVTLLVAAVLSGSGLIAALVIAVRAVYRLDALITGRHLDILARLMLVLGLASLYCHAWDAASVALHGDGADHAALERRLGGVPFRIVVLCELAPVQVFWLARARRSGLAVALVGVLVSVGAFADHLAGQLMIGTALANVGQVAAIEGTAPVLSGFALPASLGLFLALFLLSLRTLPILAVAQMRQLALLHGTDADAKLSKRAAAAGSGHTLWGVCAAFASEAALAAAIRVLAGQNPEGRLDACGPVPIPEAFAALRAPAHPMRAYALLGALLGGLGYAAWCLTGATRFETGASIPVSDGLAWSFRVLPGLSVATMTGTLAVLLAFLALSRLPRVDRRRLAPGLSHADGDRFVLSVALESDAAVERIVGRLAALPAEDGRPLAIRRVPR